MIYTAVILAGGFGTRLRSVVNDIPKPMASINGKPFLELLMETWIEKGIRKIVIGVGYKKEIIMNYFGDNYKNISIEYVQENKPLGTGGALLNILKKLNIEDPIILLNGDTFFDVSLYDLYSFHIKSKSVFTFSVFKSKDLKRYMGLGVNKQMKVESIEKKDSLSDEIFVNGGVYCISSINQYLKMFDLNKQYSLENQIIPELISQNLPIFAYPSSAKFIDIGVPDDYYKAQKILL